MDGAEVFAFTLREVVPLLRSALATAGWESDETNYFVFHQANKFMLTHLAKALKLPIGKVPLSLRDYGNTSSASIPLTITTQLREAVTAAPQRLLLAGFGVGFSWAACTMTCGPIVLPPVMFVPSSEAWPC